MKIGEIYKGKIDKRLYKIVDIFEQQNKKYVKFENLEQRKTEAKYMFFEYDTVKRFLIEKVEVKK